MATTGGGDPVLTVALLWRHRAEPRRGPRPAHTVDEVVDAGVALADEAGLDAVTMRAVAARVGVSPMAVYGYVPGKAELLDAMLDTVYAAQPRPSWRARSWRRRVTLVAEANRDLIRAHPWLLGLSSLARPPLGPGLLAKYDHELGAFDGTGLSDVEVDAALTFVLGFARTAAAEESPAPGGLSDADWWAASEPVLQRVLDPAAYPRASRVGAAAGAAQGSAYDADTAWSFGLRRVLDGLAALIEPAAG